jgi:hypothetical protein
VGRPDVNVLVVQLCCRAMMPRMLARERDVNAIWLTT